MDLTSGTDTMNPRWDFEEDFSLLRRKIRAGKLPEDEMKKLREAVVPFLHSASDASIDMVSAESTPSDSCHPVPGNHVKRPRVSREIITSSRSQPTSSMILSVIGLMIQYESQVRNELKLFSHDDEDEDGLYNEQEIGCAEENCTTVEIHQKKVLDGFRQFLRTQQMHPKKTDCPLTTDLILETIMDYLPTSDLQNCRSVCKIWKRNATSILQKRHNELNLNAIDFDLKEFCNVMEKCTDLPFRKFCLDLNESLVYNDVNLELFFSKFGTFVRELKINIVDGMDSKAEPPFPNYDEVVLCALRNSPNLNALSFDGISRQCFSEAFSTELASIVFDGVRALNFYVAWDLGPQLIEAILGMVPKTSRVNFSEIKEDEDKDALVTALLGLKHLRSLKWTDGIPISFWKTFTLKKHGFKTLITTVSQTVDNQQTDDITKFFQTQRNSLEVLEICSGETAPLYYPFLHLRCLRELTINHECPWLSFNLETLCFRPYHLPCLTKISACVECFRPIFGGQKPHVYPTVKELFLGADESVHQNRPLIVSSHAEAMRMISKMVPNLRKLTHDVKRIRRDVLEVIFEEFTKIEEFRLKIYGIGNSARLDYVLSGLSEGYKEAGVLDRLMTQKSLPEFPYCVSLLVGSSSSLLNMTGLKKLGIHYTSPFDDTKESSLSEVAVHFALLRMNRLRQLTLTGNKVSISTDDAALLASHHDCATVSYYAHAT